MFCFSGVKREELLWVWVFLTLDIIEVVEVFSAGFAYELELLLVVKTNVAMQTTRSFLQCVNFSFIVTTADLLDSVLEDSTFA